MKFIDTHCHLTLNHFNEDRPLILSKLLKELKLFIEIGIDVRNSKKAIELTKKSKNGYCSVGIHPTDSEGISNYDLDEISDMIDNEKVVAVGEIGLDFHWDTDRKSQYKVFDSLLQLAKEKNKPVIFHIREAYKEVYEFIKKHSLPDKLGVVHCYSSDWKEAKKFLDLGLYLGIDGPITYPKNKKLIEVVEKTPLNMILLETDAPFLPPVPFRGKRNIPLYVKYVYEKVASIKNISEEELCDEIEKNVFRLFF